MSCTVGDVYFKIPREYWVVLFIFIHFLRQRLCKFAWSGTYCKKPGCFWSYSDLSAQVPAWIIFYLHKYYSDLVLRIFSGWTKYWNQKSGCKRLVFFSFLKFYLLLFKFFSFYIFLLYSSPQLLSYPLYPVSCSFSLLKRKQQQKDTHKHTYNMKSVCFGQLLLIMRAALWSMIDIFSVTPVMKTDFPSPGSYQLHIFPKLGWTFVSTSSSPCWHFIWLEHVQVLCVLLQSLWVHIYNFPECILDAITPHPISQRPRESIKSELLRTVPLWGVGASVFFQRLQPPWLSLRVS